MRRPWTRRPLALAQLVPQLHHGSTTHPCPWTPFFHGTPWRLQPQQPLLTLSWVLLLLLLLLPLLLLLLRLLPLLQALGPASPGPVALVVTHPRHCRWR
jgi:hypothetical protein